jgi:cytochrome c oxidase subunit 1
VRLQLGWPTGNIPYLDRFLPPSWGNQIMPEFYAMTFSMHATIMIFFVIIPWLTGAFGNFLIR